MENLYYNIKKKGGIVYLRKFVDDSKICELHQKGLSHKEIAKELGCSPGTVTKHLLDMGIRTKRRIKDKVNWKFIILNHLALF